MCIGLLPISVLYTHILRRTVEMASAITIEITRAVLTKVKFHTRVGVNLDASKCVPSITSMMRGVGAVRTIDTSVVGIKTVAILLCDTC